MRVSGLIVLSLLSGSAEAACPDELWVWPEQGQLPANGKVLLEGRGRWAEVVEKLEQFDPTLVADTHQVRLRVAQVWKGDAGLAQAWLEPIAPLSPGRSYLLKLKGHGRDQVVTGSPEGPLAIGFYVDPLPDESAPLFLERPMAAGQGQEDLGAGGVVRTSFLYAPVRDDGEVLVKVDAYRTRDKKRRTRFAFPLGSSEVLGLGMGAGCAGLALGPGETALAQLSALDEAGHEVSAPGWGLLIRGAGLFDDAEESDPYAEPKLRAPLTLSVQVRDDLGAAVAEAQVVPSFDVGSSASTDPKGRTILRGIRQRIFTLSVQHPNLGTLLVPVELQESPDRQSVEARFQGSARLQARVQDREGKAIPQANLRLIGGEPATVREVVTNAKGQAVIGALPAGRYQVAISAVGYAPLFAGFGLLGPEEKVFALERGLSLAGVVRVPAGVPGAGWRVRIQPSDVPEGLEGSVRAQELLADDQGRFSFDALAPMAYRLVAWRPEGGELLLGDGHIEQTVSVAPATPPVVIEIPTLVLVEGVVEYHGRPPPTVLEVTVRDGPADEVRPQVDPARGRYTLLLRSAARYTVELRAPGFQRDQKVLALRGVTKLRVDHRLEPASGIRGRVRGAAGTPIPGARVGAWTSGDDGPTQVVFADSEGRFLLDQVSPSPGVVISAHARGFVSQTAPSGATIELALARGAPIYGWLTGDSAGAQAWIGLRSYRGASPPGVETRAGPAGRFLLDRMPLGRYQAEVRSADGHRIWIRPFVHDGQKDARLGIYEARSQVIIERDPALRALGKMELSMVGPGAPPARVVVPVPLDAESEAISVQDLSPGAYVASLDWVGPGGVRERVAEQPFELAAGAPAPLRLTLRPRSR